MSDQMRIDQAQMILVCGPNGAGKSTLTRGTLDAGAATIPFVDPDRLARERGYTAVQTGRVVSRLLREYLSGGQSFLRESTLSSKYDLDLIATARAKGFYSTLIYICVPAVDICLARVRSRHQYGGHFVPDDDVRRRYTRSLHNLPQAVASVDAAVLLDNGGRGYRTVARYAQGRLLHREYAPAWFTSAHLTTRLD